MFLGGQTGADLGAADTTPLQFPRMTPPDWAGMVIADGGVSADGCKDQEVKWILLRRTDACRNLDCAIRMSFGSGTWGAFR